MNPLVFWALLATLVTWAFTTAGAGTVAFVRNAGTRQMNLLLGFAAGVMLAASYFSLLAPAVELAEAAGGVPPFLVAVCGFLAGAAFLWLSDLVLRRLARRKGAPPAGGAEGNGAADAPPLPPAPTPRGRLFLLILSITLHNIPEGLVVGVAFGSLGVAYTPEALWGAVSIAVGIALQNFPEGAAVSLPMRREGYSRRRAFLFGAASGAVEPIAGLLGACLVLAVKALLPYALAFAAGAMVLVCVHELIPECEEGREAHPYVATAGVMLGFALMMLLDVALG